MTIIGDYFLITQKINSKKEKEKNRNKCPILLYNYIIYV